MSCSLEAPAQATGKISEDTTDLFQPSNAILRKKCYFALSLFIHRNGFKLDDKAIFGYQNSAYFDH